MSEEFQMVHHWSVSVSLSDHNPVIADVVTNDKDLEWWEWLKGGGV